MFTSLEKICDGVARCYEYIKEEYLEHKEAGRDELLWLDLSLGFKVFIEKEVGF